MTKLNVGVLANGKPFTLPADLGDKKIALLAQSKKGKTYGLGDILEELAKAQRPFIATDPANNLWGLRVRPDGSPSGLPVVVVGGDHADIPFEKDAGERMAEALLAEPICAVIDLAFESAGATRHFMTAFAGRLMRSKPEVPRVIVLEECPVLIPQSAFGVQAQVCKAAVSKLAIIGGNFGYGVIPACQRPATMDKDVLSQCEALIVMGMTHKKDRATVKEWMEAKDIGDRVADCFKELGSLEAGEAWYWNPGEDLFQRFRFRKRETLHPREMQKLGLKASSVRLGDMEKFVQRVKRELTRHQVQVTLCDVPKNRKTAKSIAAMAIAARDPAGPGPAIEWRRQNLAVRAERDELLTVKANLEQQVDNFKAELAQERARTREAQTRLEAVRSHLRPKYIALRALFEDLGDTSTTTAGGQSLDGPWAQWLEKAAKIGARKFLEVLVTHGRLTQPQLATLAGVSIKGGHWKKCRAFATRNQLARLEGGFIEAVRL